MTNGKFYSPPPKSHIGFTRKTICDICGFKRNKGDHTNCSRIRQAKFAEENQKG